MTTSDRPSVQELRSALLRQLQQAAFLESVGRERFIADDVESTVHQLAASHLIVQFASLLEDFPDDLRRETSSAPWAQVRGMRNRLAHGYSDVDPDMLWQVVAVNLPRFGDLLIEKLDTP